MPYVLNTNVSKFIGRPGGPSLVARRASPRLSSNMPLGPWRRISVNPEP